MMPGLPHDPPIFLVGVDRSGTTLLAMMLDSHSRIAIPHESHFFIEFHKRRHTFGDLSQEANKRRLVEEILRQPYLREWNPPISPEEIDLTLVSSLESAITAIYRAYAGKTGKVLWGDKTPRYLLDIPILNAMFPEARFIHLVRDGRDVALSITRMWWGAKDFASALHYWRDSVFCARRILAMLPGERQMELRFEDLVANPARELQRISSFLGVEYEEGMLAYSEHAADKVGRDRIRAHHQHLREQPSMAQTYKWKKLLSKAEQALAFAIAGDVLTELGYPPGTRQHPFRLASKIRHGLAGAYRWRKQHLLTRLRAGSGKQADNR